MNIYTRKESSKGTEHTEWMVSKEITEIVEPMDSTSVVRNFNTKENPPTPINFYN
jgi:hypothetical protein